MAKRSRKDDLSARGAHVRHRGVMIDASFGPGGKVEYYVVEGSSGRFYNLPAAKEVAEGVAQRRKGATSSRRKPGRLHGLGDAVAERQAQSAIGDAETAKAEAGRGACKRAFEAVLRAQGSSFYAMGGGVSRSTPLGQQSSEAVQGAIDAFTTSCLAKLPGRMLSGLTRVKRKNPKSRNSKVVRAAKACRALAKGGGITNPRYQACLRQHLRK